MKIFIGFIKALKSFWKLYRDYEYDGEVLRHIIETYTAVICNRTKTMSKPTYYLYDVLSEMDRYYEGIYEEDVKENEELHKKIEFLEERHNYLRTRCMESARDSFDKGLYGVLTIVKGEKLSPSEFLMHMSDGIGHTETLKKFGIEINNTTD